MAKQNTLILVVVKLVLCKAIVLRLGCSPVATNCTHGNIRLSGGLGPTEGRVEVCVQGRWSGVCHSSWNYQDAFVVCRQLGYPATGLGDLVIMLRIINTDSLLCCIYMMPASAVCSCTETKIQLFDSSCMFVFSENLNLPDYQFKWSWIVTIDYLKWCHMGNSSCRCCSLHF